MRALELWIIILICGCQWDGGEGKQSLDTSVTDWELVFIGVAKSNQQMYNFWRNDLNPSRCTPNYGCLPSNKKMNISSNPPNRHLKSILVDKWICLLTRWVKLEVHSNNKRVAYFIFNGTATSRSSWFDDDRLMESSYSDLYEDTCYSRSYLYAYYFKSFMIATKQDHNNYCVSKRGWLQVIDYLPTHSYFQKCDWTKAAFGGTTQYPLILYAKGRRSTVWRDREFAEADTIGVYISRINKKFSA